MVNELFLSRNFMTKNKNIILIYLITTLLFCVFHGECSAILCDDPTADNYNESSECGCKYSDLFEGQGNSLCPSEISFLVYQEWMATDFCFSFQNGNQYWTKAKYDEFMTNLANIYNLSYYIFYETDICDRSPGEYYSTRYEETYENGDCKIDVLDITRSIWILYKCGKCGVVPVCGCVEQDI